MGNREHILSEIRRLAAANGGRSPGEQSFETETGIKEAAWRGIFWARWGAALVEAGLTPNALTAQTDIDQLFFGLSQAVRHYRKFPTAAEIRMYRRIDKALPSHSTLSNRFSSKEQMLADFHGWLVGHPEHDDVLGLLPSPKPPEAVAPRAAVREGFVYLIGSGRHFKIGRSDTIERRVKEIKIALPEAATLVHTIRTDDPPGIEAYWHRRFADKRANGEWFTLTSQDVAAFKRRKYQ